MDCSVPSRRRAEKSKKLVMKSLVPLVGVDGVVRTRLFGGGLQLFGLGPPKFEPVRLGRGFLFHTRPGLAGFREREDISHQTSRLCSLAASMKLAKRGWGSKGRDFSSGWNCTPMNQGWSVRSTISGSLPSGEVPEKSRPLASSTLR